MNMTRREAVATLAAPLAALPFVGCGSSSIISLLDVVAVAADAAVPVITAFAPQLGPFAQLAIDYAKGIANATALSIAEMQSADSTTVKFGKIFGYYTGTVIAIPAGVASEVQSVISAITAAVQLLLIAIGHGSIPTATAMKVTQNNPLLSKYQAQVKALGSDSARISDAMAHAAHVQQAHL